MEVLLHCRLSLKSLDFWEPASPITSCQCMVELALILVCIYLVKVSHGFHYDVCDLDCPCSLQEEENRLREELRQEWERKQEKIKSKGKCPAWGGDCGGFYFRAFLWFTSPYSLLRWRDRDYLQLLGWFRTPKNSKGNYPLWPYQVGACLYTDTYSNTRIGRLLHSLN